MSDKLKKSAFFAVESKDPAQSNGQLSKEIKEAIAEIESNVDPVYLCYLPKAGFHLVSDVYPVPFYDLLHHIVGDCSERVPYDPFLEQLGYGMWIADNGKLRNEDVSFAVFYHGRFVDVVVGPCVFAHLNHFGVPQPLTGEDIQTIISHYSERVWVEQEKETYEALLMDMTL